jgi:DNA (cytosine-5)-methyltransferase 1
MVGAVDMNAIATETYSANFEKTKVTTDRLENVNLSALKRDVGAIDLLIASPECTNHTCAKGSAPRSEESRATAMQVVRFAAAFKPRWLVLENVVHMRPWSRYSELRRDLEDLGYHIKEYVLDASDYGVPQTRRRLFIVGDRKRTPQFYIPKRPGRRPSVRSILDFGGAWSTSPLFGKKRAADTLQRASRAISKLGSDASFLIVYYGSDGSGGWQPLTRPLRTVTTIDRFALVEPKSNGYQMRMLQVPELKRAMGFEDGYLFPVGTRRDKIRLLGNGVCPPVMSELLKSLFLQDTAP